MDKVENYRDEAAAALELSAFEEDSGGKMALLIIAKGWLDLAKLLSSPSDNRTKASLQKAVTGLSQ